MLLYLLWCVREAAYEEFMCSNGLWQFFSENEPLLRHLICIIFHNFLTWFPSESCLTIVIVKISIPKVEIAVLKNLPIFGNKKNTCYKFWQGGQLKVFVTSVNIFSLYQALWGNTKVNQAKNLCQAEDDHLLPSRKMISRWCWWSNVKMGLGKGQHYISSAHNCQQREEASR